MSLKSSQPRVGPIVILAAIVVLLGIAPAGLFAQTPGPCTRYAAGSVVQDTPNLFSINGVLRVNLIYNREVDADGRVLFCFTTPSGKESPTLHVQPGDLLIIKLTNEVPESVPATAMRMQMTNSGSDVCGAANQTPASVNMHFHGTNVAPTCHSDEVIHTLVNTGQSFTYRVRFPEDETPGLYWYHPHVHGSANAAVQGGASGAIVVTGLERVQPAVSGLRQRIFVIRDQNVTGDPPPFGSNNVPSWDVSMNYVPIPYPDYTPGIIQMKPGEKELWRVANASADTQLDLQLQYDGTPQMLQVVGLDGAPTGPRDKKGHGTIIPMTDILLPTAARAEFIVTAPPATVSNATFLTLNVDTGAIGDNDPQRPLALIQTVAGRDAGAPIKRELTMPTVAEAPGPQRFDGLATAPVTAQRTLYFSEVITDEQDPGDWLNTQFFITVAGATPQVFNPDNPPAITTTQGAVEDWTIENHSEEVHEFHLHQIHFLLLAINGVPVPAAQQQLHDMIQVPYWTGTGPYPSVTVRMDFRGPDVGDFVYHCHILAHEDGGMMAIIRVLPRTASAAGPYGRLRTLLASIGWPSEEPQSSEWCGRRP